MAVITNDECLICKGNNVKKYNAVFSDFIAERVFDNQNKNFDFVHCLDCGFSFYTYRFEDKEATKLYKNYRDDDYQEQRQKHESWYSRDINNLIGKNEKEINSRCSHLTACIFPFLSDKDLSSLKILDFGGDKGQFIPSIFKNSEKYVYDISAQPVLDGIIPITSSDELKDMQFDIIICAHVLEHVTDPQKIIEQIRTLLKPGGLLYLELPFDSPFCKNMLSNIQYLFNPHYKLKDIIKQYIKLRKQKSYTLHEHINYFTAESAEMLLKNNSFTILKSEQFKIKSDTGSGKAISVLARI